MKSQQKGGIRVRKSLHRIDHTPSFFAHDNILPSTLRCKAQYEKVENQAMAREEIGVGTSIFIVDGFLNDFECKSWVRFGELANFEQLSNTGCRVFAARNHGRREVDDVDAARKLFGRMVPFLPDHIEGKSAHSCSSNIRLYRYNVNESFGKHIDESRNDDVSGGVTKLTALIYLTGDCLGGETIFYHGKRDCTVLARISPVAGRLLLHAHGSRCLTHEASPVMDGVKYVLRTDVVFV